MPDSNESPQGLKFADVPFDPTLSRRQQKRALFQKKARDAQGYVNETAFRQVERKYRTRIPPPDLSEVIDFRPGATNHPDIASRIVPVALNPAWQTERRRLQHVFGQWTPGHHTGYMLLGFPGLIFIPNPFTPTAQRRLVKQCLRQHARPPHKSNLDAHYQVPDEGVWNRHEGAQCHGWDDADPRGQVPAALKPSPGNHCPNSTAATGQHQSPPPKPTPHATATALVPKLRWVTLGYQYDWSRKEYFLNSPLAFPQDLDDLSRAIVTAIHDVGYGVAGNTSPPSQYTTIAALPPGYDHDRGYVHHYDPAQFQAEAGVINYYQTRDTLMAHVDRSEVNMDAPLVSLSLGNSAIFVIGEESREAKPLALYVRSGDILCMCGPRRKAYHGIPRVLENTLPEYLQPQLPAADTDTDWPLFGAYMLNARLNVNVRQVL
ncbi:hypothetical protein H4R34_001754 [Dimargaris verticillata]|uniref:Fe2OG dioxygenase domain-containing protein n=1 Tax=Dimargaris verticillata TaxID=2761393 RepID=A0A9W8EEP3_9FUNG|nr:hypothetical protein H4R34_001754 [Dimargaris verticillata]